MKTIELKDTEKLFLDFYLSNGLNPAKRIECYKMAFTTKSEGLTDPSIQTYAKTILASQPAKEYIGKRKISNSTSSFQLMESIRFLDNMLKEEDLKPLERVQILKERRISINDLSRLIEVINPIVKDENELVVADFQLNIINPIKAHELTNDEAHDLLQPSKMNKILSIGNDGTIKSLIPSMWHNSDKFNTAIDRGEFKIGMKRKDLEAMEISKGE